MEQRYQAVLEVQAGVPVVDVARGFGVSRQAVHRWKNRYRSGGLEALADRSKRPKSSPWQVPAEVEALVCEMRRMHPRWGPRRIRAELAKQPEFTDGTSRLPHRSSIYRILVRFDLLTVKPRRRKRSEYKRWQRDAPMELWQTSDSRIGSSGGGQGRGKGFGVAVCLASGQAVVELAEEPVEQVTEGCGVAVADASSAVVVGAGGGGVGDGHEGP